MGSGSDCHHQNQHRHSNQKPSHGQEQEGDHHLFEVNPKPKLSLQEKNRHMIDDDDDDGQDQVVTTSNTRICVDCKASKTPLWRSGPHGPKSLCNACGIRYRKRRRREFEFLKTGKGISMKGKKKKNNGQIVDEERMLLLLQGKFAGKEEAEAALLLMALSCGFCVR